MMTKEWVIFNAFSIPPLPASIHIYLAFERACWGAGARGVAPLQEAWRLGDLNRPGAPQARVRSPWGCRGNRAERVDHSLLNPRPPARHPVPYSSEVTDSENGAGAAWGPRSTPTASCGSLHLQAPPCRPRWDAHTGFNWGACRHSTNIPDTESSAVSALSSLPISLNKLMDRTGI